ncbi:hypothetical protein P692DRAFT_20878490 [Suillus brevipes Sb2]|nr:hypothetical protein P692DRAFT_20878490 [Suillus brevipes Sb2]
MAPRRWTTSQELEWLQNELPEFLKMQKEQKLTRFYELLYPKWFSHFPERFKYWEPTGNPPHGQEEVDHQNPDSDVLLPLTPEQEAKLEGANEIRRKKLKEWFRNNAKSKTTPGSTSTSKALAQLLGQRARGLCDLKDSEVYSRTYYKTKVQPLVKDDIQENQLDAKNRIAIVQKHVHQCFEAEPEEVKAEIRKEAARINASRKLGSVFSDRRTKEEVYRAIQELPMVLGQICDDLGKLTGGWHFSVVMGGVDPMCPGDIMTLSYHHGKNQDGHSFKAANPDFNEQYLMPFEKHLRRIFSDSSSSLPIPSPSPPQAHTHHDPEEPSIPNDTRTPVPVESLMDPNFPVCDADIDAFLATIGPLASDGPHGEWWQIRNTQTPTPPVVNSPPAITPSVVNSPPAITPSVVNSPPAITPSVINTPPTIPVSSIESPMQGQNSSMVNDSSTPPRIRRPLLNAVPSSLSKSIRLPPADAGDSLPVIRVSATPLPSSVTTTTSVDNNSHSLLPVSSAPAPLTDTTSNPTATNILLPAGSVPPVSTTPPVSTAPGRRSVRATRPSTRAEDANKIGDDITSKHKRKAGSQAVVAVKKCVFQFSVPLFLTQY